MEWVRWGAGVTLWHSVTIEEQGKMAFLPFVPSLNAKEGHSSPLVEGGEVPKRNEVLLGITIIITMRTAGLLSGGIPLGAD